VDTSRPVSGGGAIEPLATDESSDAAQCGQRFDTAARLPPQRGQTPNEL